MKSKHVFTVFFTCLTIFGLAVLLSFKSAPPDIVDAHRIGDVLYSILPPAQFKEQHGDGWKLLDGQPFDANCSLVKQYHPAIAPDARGVFIRGMNESRDINDGDPDGERTVGAPQKDMFGQHTHDIGYPQGAYLLHGLYTNSNGTYSVDPKQNFAKSAPAGGSETRPRNIALYTYIKVN